MTDGASPIVRVSWRSFRVPFAAAAQTSRARLAVRDGYIVRIETADGLVGIGEASPLADFEGGDFSEVGTAIESIARSLVGRSPAEAWDHACPHGAVSPASGRVARAGMETALGDVLAQQSGLPLWAWLAARFEIAVKEPVTVPANALIDATDAAGVERQVREAAAEGYQAVKVKVGTDPVGDVERLRATRQASMDIELRIDANGAWDDSTALNTLTSLEEFNIALCEQPLDPRRADVMEATARLRTRVGVPIALDESCRTPDDVRRAYEARAVDAVVIKPMFAGLQDAVGMIRMARDANLPAIVTTTFDSGVGTAMARHVAALLAAPRPACGLATLSRLEHPLIGKGQLEDGPVITTSERPGLGVAIDEAALQRFAGDVAGEITG